MKTFGTSLKGFQTKAVDSAVRVMDACLEMIKETRHGEFAEANRNTAVGKLGHILFEAPTGIGKTMMTGTTVEKISVKHKVIWFWFAPYKGVIDQTISAIKEEHKALRPKSVQKNRAAADLRSGDVFVTTWAALAVENADARNARKSSESQLSIDELISYAKSNGFTVGVVIDEAHHSFRAGTQAHYFYQKVIDPDLTIMVTATPNDKDIDAFTGANNIDTLNRVVISRDKGVNAGLLKRGVKVGIFRPTQGYERFVDLKKAALQYGVETHRRLKAELVEQGIPLTPLLLVQVDSGADSVKNAQKWLKEEGFTDEQVKTHTADEPDPHLLAIAADEQVEVLIFKMAVAMGFDAPRASTLVSMRNTVDANWGVQIVGRIMRIHRKLQGVNHLPPRLECGYVFISNEDGQVGLTEAADRINSLEDELATVTDNIAIVTIGNDQTSLQETTNGQTTLLPPEDAGSSSSEGSAEHRSGGNGETDDTDNNSVIGSQTELEGFNLEQTLEQMDLGNNSQKKDNTDTGDNSGTNGQTGTNSNPAPGKKRYLLRDDIEYPKAFLTTITNPDQDRIIDDIISELRLTDAIHGVLRQYVQINVTTTDIFKHESTDTDQLNVKLTENALAKDAQTNLNLADREGYIDPRDFRKKLEAALKSEMEALGLEQAGKPEEIKKCATRLLALESKRLKKAVRLAINKHTKVKTAAPLPEYIESDIPLKDSRLNIYKVFPSDMGGWEKPFTQVLDQDSTGIVKWWHRNPDRKKYSVAIPVPGYDNYYPDFIVGVNDRQHGEGILLIETKERINDTDGLAQAKTQVQHPAYLKPMMLYWKDQRDWFTVKYEENTGKNILDRIFRKELLQTYTTD